MFISVREWKKDPRDAVTVHPRFTVQIAYRRETYLLFSWEKLYLCTQKPQFTKIFLRNINNTSKLIDKKFKKKIRLKFKLDTGLRGNGFASKDQTIYMWRSVTLTSPARAASSSGALELEGMPSMQSHHF
jgi:hypothetical protein